MADLATGRSTWVSLPGGYRGGVASMGAGGSLVTLLASPSSPLPYCETKPQELELFTWADGAFVPRGVLGDLPCTSLESVLWTSPDEDVAALASGWGCDVLVDTSRADAPAVAWTGTLPGNDPTRAFRLVGDRMLRLRGEGADAVATLDRLDRTIRPWQVSPLAEVALPEAAELLAFDGRIAVFGGAASDPEDTGLGGTAWVVDFAGPEPEVTAVPTPEPPEWGLGLPQGLLLSAEGGVGSLQLTCGE